MQVLGAGWELFLFFVFLFLFEIVVIKMGETGSFRFTSFGGFFLTPQLLFFRSFIDSIDTIIVIGIVVSTPITYTISLWRAKTGRWRESKARHGGRATEA